MLGIKSNYHTRTVIGLGSFFCVSLGLVGAFGSVMRIGQNVQSQSRIQENLQMTRDSEVLKTQTEAEIVKARQKNGLGDKASQFVILGLNDKNFFKVTTKNAKAIRNFAQPDQLTNLLDEHQNIVGTFNGSQVCNLRQECKRI